MFGRIFTLVTFERLFFGVLAQLLFQIIGFGAGEDALVTLKRLFPRRESHVFLDVLSASATVLTLQAEAFLGLL